jgi:hypothetical protein
MKTGTITTFLRKKIISYTKSPTVGGPGGYLFDSGCNPEGVKKIFIVCGEYSSPTTGINCRSSIKRIYFDEAPEKGKDVIYHAVGVDVPTRNGAVQNKDFTVDIGPDESIVKIKVWTNDEIVNAVQFHMNNGRISPMYGTGWNCNGKEPSTLLEGTDDSIVVGFHGRYAGVIESLGFSFATFESTTPSTIGGSDFVGIEVDNMT